jgi:hypothetical protein
VLLEKSPGTCVTWAGTQPPPGERLTEQFHPRRNSDRDQIRWQELKRRLARKKLETERLTHLGDWARLGSGGQARESYQWPMLRNSKSGPTHKNETERRLTGACHRRDTKICQQQEKPGMNLRALTHEREPRSALRENQIKRRLARRRKLGRQKTKSSDGSSSRSRTLRRAPGTEDSYGNEDPSRKMAVERNRRAAMPFLHSKRHMLGPGDGRKPTVKTKTRE